jgi:hypothetical protein
MTVKLSTGALNGMTGRLGFAGMFNHGVIKVFSGAQPANADAAETGTLLGIFSKSSLTPVRETRATGTLTVTGSEGQTILTVTAGGVNIIPDDATIVGLATTTLTAAAVADAINRNGMYEASSASNVVTVKARPGSGAVTTALATTGTCAVTGSSMSGGVAPSNGLILGAPVAGVVSKSASQVWSFNGLAAGTAGWARFYASDAADTGAALSVAPWYPRLDGSCGVGSGDFRMSTLNITVSLPVTMDGFSWTQPTL